MMWGCCICHKNMTYNWSHICDECAPPKPQKKSRRGMIVAALCLIGVAVLVGWPS